MAEKEKTPIYEKHKKVHDLVGKLQQLGEDEHSTGLASHIHQAASDYLHKNKSIDGKVNWSEKGGDEEHKKFSDKLWDTAADRIAKHYLKLDDNQIKDLKKGKTADGESLWETMIAQYFGGMTKEVFFDKVKDENELTIENILSVYVKNLASMHVSYRHHALVRQHIKTGEDMDLASSYLGVAKKHNKKSLKKFKSPKKFKSIEEAADALATAAQYVPKSYHPDKPDSYH
jgi:hypothetical protein